MMKKMKNYKYLIFDADHTLYDYIADELQAFRDLYAEISLPITGELLAFSRRASEDIWTETGLYDVHSPRIQAEYHNLYRSHVQGIFQRVFEKFPCSADPKKTGERFLYYLSKQGQLYPQAKPILSALSKNQGGRYEIAIATNGLRFIQDGRLKEIKGLVKEIFISENLGAIKPLPAFFEKVLSALGARADECLMIGDSLSSDIVGAKGAGMSACWFNPDKKPLQGEVQPDYEISDLQELLTLLNE